MGKRVTRFSFSNLMTKSSIMADNIALNAEKLSKYGLEIPAFTNEMKADVEQLSTLDKEQERLKSELKAKTEALNALQAKLEKDYALAKKTVKLAEPQVSWKGYGIDDKQ